MTQNFNTAVTDANKDEWLTPPFIIQALGDFDLDPCAPSQAARPWPTAARHICLPDDGLTAPWAGRVWLNPPYGSETFKWLARLADHRNGIALIFARTETIGFHAQIFEKAKAIFFFKGRLRFHHVSGQQGGAANAPSCLVAYSGHDADKIYQAHKAGAIKGRLVWLGE